MTSSVKLLVIYLSFFGAPIIWVDFFYAVNALLLCFALFWIAMSAKINYFIFINLISTVFLLLIFHMMVSIGNPIHLETYRLYLKALAFVFVAFSWMKIFDLNLDGFLDSQFHKYLIMCGLLQCLIVLAMVMFPSLKDAIYSISTLYIIEKHEMVRLARVTDPGIGGTSFGFLICGLFIGAELLIAKNGLRLSYFSRFLMRAIVLLTLLVTARSGLVVYLFLLFLIMVKFKLLDLFIFLTVVACAGLCLMFMRSLFISSDLMSWVFEILNPLQSRTVQYLLKSFYFPSDFQTMMFGGARYQGATDSLLIKLIYSVGLPALLLVVIFPTLWILFCINKSKAVSIWNKYYFNCIYFILLLGNLKEGLWSSSRGAGLFFILSVCIAGSYAFKWRVLSSRN